MENLEFETSSSDKQEYFSKEIVDKALAQLSCVGPDKLIGYLPLDTVTKMQMDAQILEKHFKNRGLKTMFLTEDESDVYGGAFYV